LNKKNLIGIGIAVIAVAVFVLAITNPDLRENKDTWFGFIDTAPEPVPPVTQQDLRVMIDEWMENPQKDDREQRLQIMRAYYTFEESGQKLSDDQAGRVMLNQIRKMVSVDIPKEELDQIREDIREKLKEQGFEVRE
jgi:hypothetical protein